MKEIDFIGSENVVNMASLAGLILIEERDNSNNGFILDPSIVKKNRLQYKKNDSTHFFNVYGKYFEVFFDANLYIFNKKCYFESMRGEKQQHESITKY